MIKSLYTQIRSRLSSLFFEVEGDGEYTAKLQICNPDLCQGLACEQIIDNFEFQMDSTGVQEEMTKGEDEELATTSIQDAGTVAKVALAAPQGRSNLLMIPRDQANVDLQTYFMKPTLLSNGVFTAGFATLNWDVMDPLYTTDLYSSKLKGFYGVRATPVFTLKVNANRFVAGMYVISFVPSGGEVPAADFVRLGRIFSTTQKSTLLSAHADVNCDSSVELRIPWTSVVPYAKVVRTNLEPREGSPGDVILWEYSAVVNYGDGTPVTSYSLYIHYEDVELYGAALPQSGLFEHQSGRSKKKANPTWSEMMDDKPISGGLSLLSKAAENLSTIPLLSSIALPVHWLADAAARTAAFFGYSAPPVVNAPHRVFPQSTPYLFNYDKHSLAMPLTFSTMNQVSEVSGMGGTSYDEMSIDYLKGKFAFVQAFSIAPTTVDPASITINPVALYSTATDGANAVRNYIPVSFLCLIHAYWRGSIAMKLRFVKTEFHIGRIEVLFNPANYAVTTPSDSTGGYLYRRIIDIREGNEFVFLLPFISEQSWKPCIATTAGDLGQVTFRYVDQVTYGSGTGNLAINVLVEYAGGPDFEVAAPRSHDWRPYVPNTQTQSGVWRNKSVINDMVVENSDEPQCRAGVTFMGASLHTKPDLRQAAVCMGEAVMSLNQHVKSGGFIGYVASPSGIQFSIFQGVNDNNAGGTISNVPYTADPVSILMSMYAICRGGVRVTFIDPSNERGTTLPMAILSKNLSLIENTMLRAATITSADNNGGQTVVQYTADGALTVDIPQYTVTPGWVTNRLIRRWDASTSTRSNYGQGNVLYLVKYGATITAGETNGLIHRAGKDDFHAYAFVSIMPSLASNFS